MIEAAALVSKKAIAVNGLENLERWREIGAARTGWEVKAAWSKAYIPSIP